MAETVATTVVEVVAEKGIQAIVHQIGYCINYKKSVKSLDEKVKALQDMRTEIQERVTAAKKNLDSIKNDVEIWLENVRKEMEEDEIMAGLMNFINGEEARMFKHDQCCKGWCCILTRHKIGREAQKKIVDMEKLLNEGKSFNDVSYPSANLVASVITQFVSTDGNIAFESREIIMNEIMSALKDKGTYSVGIYGMGGVGKTMLKNRVHKQVVEEKLFSIVATTTASQSMNVTKIQDDIAQTLAFHKLNGIDDTTARAALLLRRLEQEENILVIIDDLWTMNLNLRTDVGIPYCYKGCKLLITTRIPEVCLSLKIQKIVEVKGLSEDESWHLFKQNVGDVVDSPAIQTVAREVIKECCRLPLALVTVGRALQNKDKFEWDYIANQLKRSSFTDIEGMTSEVYTPIKLSYDFLGDDILKRCFLLCSLFSEDSNIHVDDLLIYAVGDGVIRRDLETLAELRVRLYKAFTKLVALGLLIRDKEDDDQKVSVKMHDIVRDVAISIASGNDYRFYIKAGLHLKNWPEEGLSSMSSCSRLSLIDNNITALPDQPELQHLLSLSLRNNYSLEKIPDKFFKNMKSLQSLDIHHTQISTLPSSISSLANLRSLDMGFCLYHGQLDMSALGELKKLEILNLARLREMQRLPVSLPKEIGGLSRLKWLNLSGNVRLTVPPGIISRLTCLEYLNMENSFHGWEVGEIRGESCRYANLDEITSLTCLNHVTLCATWGDNQSLKIFTEQYNISGPLHCYVRSSFPFCDSINILVAKAETTVLNGCSNLKNLASLITSSKESGFNNVKRLQSENCNEMECVLDSATVPVAKDEIPKALFPALEVLSLRSLGNLKEVFHGPVPAESSLKNLKRVELYRCKNLVCIFSLDVWSKLKNLEELKVDDCYALKEVFPLEKGRRILSPNDQKQELGDTLLPKLRKLRLEDLSITSIWKQPIFSLGNLKSIEVIRCSELKYLFTPAIVTALQQLEMLWIRNCGSLVTIVASDDELTEEGNQIMNNYFQTMTMFPNMRILEIKSCNVLKVFCPPVIDMHCPMEMLVIEEEVEEEDDDHCPKPTIYHLDSNHNKRALILQRIPYIEGIWGGIIPFQGFLNVTDVKIMHCAWLKHLIPMQVLLSGGLSQLRKIDVRNCERLEAIFDSGGDIIVADPQNSIILENLEVLIIWNCKSFKHLLPMKLLLRVGLPKLKVIKVGCCANIKMICYEDHSSCDDDGGGGDSKSLIKSALVEVFPKLRDLDLYRLPKLSSFHQQKNTSIHFSFPSLKWLTIVKCNLKRLPLSHKNVPPKLKKIVGDSEGMFEKWLELEDESMKSTLQSFFQVYGKDELDDYDSDDDESDDDDSDDDKVMRYRFFKETSYWAIKDMMMGPQKGKFDTNWSLF